MESKVEGLLIHKVVQGDRNIVGKLLLRSGRIASVIFYGGLGGGKKIKPSILELGFMLKIDLKEGSFKSKELFSAKEWSVVWRHSQIRFDHEAYYLLCFYLEVILRLSTQDDLHDKNREFDKSLEGMFRVLSNAIFYLEDALIKKAFNKSTHLSVFILKLIFELGINPQTKDCIFCKQDLRKLSKVFLVPEHGGFVCSSCIDDNVNVKIQDMPDSGKDLLNLFNNVFALKFQDYSNVPTFDKDLNHLLVNYLFYQLGFEKNNFKTIPFVL